MIFPLFHVYSVEHISAMDRVSIVSFLYSSLTDSSILVLWVKAYFARKLIELSWKFTTKDWLKYAEERPFGTPFTEPKQGIRSSNFQFRFWIWSLSCGPFLSPQDLINLLELFFKFPTKQFICKILPEWNQPRPVNFKRKFFQ